MSYKATPEVLSAIRREVERRKLSVSEIMQMLSYAGTPLAESTIRRVLRNDSEAAAGFRYETSVRPLWNLLMNDKEDAEEKDLQRLIADRDALIMMKNEAIADLRDRLAAMELAFGEKCKECMANQALWREQIKLKDQRIDRKDRQIDDLHDANMALQSKVDWLLDIVIGNKQKKAYHGDAAKNIERKESK